MARKRASQFLAEDDLLKPAAKKEESREIKRQPEEVEKVSGVSAEKEPAEKPGEKEGNHKDAQAGPDSSEIKAGQISPESGVQETQDEKETGEAPQVQPETDKEAEDKPLKTLSSEKLPVKASECSVWGGSISTELYKRFVYKMTLLKTNRMELINRICSDAASYEKAHPTSYTIDDVVNNTMEKRDPSVPVTKVAFSMNDESRSFVKDMSDSSGMPQYRIVENLIREYC